LEVIDLQPHDLALTAPENQPGLLAIRIDRQFVGEHLHLSRRFVRFEVEAGTSAIATPNHAQLFERTNATRCYVTSRMIQ
jgi:hypothetical protein